MNSDQVRDAFISFFRDHNHQVVKGSSVVPDNDPTLLFTNAGMNQFKDVFLGTGSRSYSRAVDSQLCIRVSGKHNDLEDVGRDGTHLTIFEMLGNWSFGDYYKKEAIIWAWEFLTKVLAFPEHKLYATVYEEDDEAAQLWKTYTSINPQHIVACGKKDNFWEMGETGPCGPCSEIHLDLASDSAPTDIERDPETGGLSERYVELWNLVFIQYNRQADQTLEPLPQQHVDTGAGLERLVAQLQGVSSVYDTDLFQPLIKKITELTGIPYESGEKGMPHRVIADHIRTLSFGIADNVIPSNEGRGYVLRRLLRRAMRYAKQMGHEGPLLHQLVETLVTVMGDFFDHVRDRKDLIISIIKAEEDAFLRTLDAGVAIFEEMAAKCAQTQESVLSGEHIFKLYDTYGFPVDLTRVMAVEKGIELDEAGFEHAFTQQQDQSRADRKKRRQQAGTETFTAQEKEDAPVHPSIFTETKGGEARLVYSVSDQVGMARHHTGTHLLHEALRDVLGEHVKQAGSVVDVHKLHFDFSHFQQVTKAELSRIEEIVNEKINEKLPVTIDFTTLEEAKKRGAMALFGDAYDDDDVRVVGIGQYSTELCGGHHVQNTEAIQAFKITHETAVATGIRRIEAISGNDDIQVYINKQEDKYRKQVQARYDKLKEDYQQLRQFDPETAPLAPCPDLMNLSLTQLKDLERDFMEQLKQCEKSLQIAKDRAAGQDMKTVMDQVISLPDSDLNILIHRCEGYDLPMLRSLSDNVVNMSPNMIIVFASEHDGAGLFLVRLPRQFTQFKAGELFKKLTEIAGGRGGGPPHMAQGGGADPQKLDQALESIKTYLHSLSSVS